MNTDRNVVARLAIMMAALLVTWMTGVFECEPAQVKPPVKTPDEIREMMKNFPEYYIPAEYPPTVFESPDPATPISTAAIPPPEFDPPLLSVSRFDNTTPPAGWYMATVSYRQDKFILYYNSTEERMMHRRGDGSDRISITYQLTDERPGPNDWKSACPFQVEIYSANDIFRVKWSDKLKCKNAGSKLRQLDKSKAQDGEIFKEMFRKLEEITPPPPLLDE